MATVPTWRRNGLFLRPGEPGSIANGNAPTLFRAGSLMAFTGRHAWLIQTRSAGPTQSWAGIPLKDFIIYELHTGTFTTRRAHSRASFRACRIFAKLASPRSKSCRCRSSRKPELGYDGASLYPPQFSYGGPNGLEEAGRCLPPPRPRGSNGCGLQPSRSGRELSPRFAALFYRRPSHARGKAINSMAPRATVCAAGSSTTLSIG